MANYDTLLKTWGATGTEFPDGYSYIEGEQPVDDWDNFIQDNTIEDIQHLISLTNSRIESDSGTTFPDSPEATHTFYRTDEERLYAWNDTSSEWDGLLKAGSDTLEGNLDLDGYNITNVGLLEMAGEADLSGNDLKDTTEGNLLYDASAGHIPLASLEESQVTVSSGSHLSGGGSVSLGGSLTIDVEDDFLLNTGDRLTGELVGERGTSSRVFTAADSATGDKLALRISSSDTFQLVGYDSSDGAWDYNNSLSYNPGTAVWSFGSLPSVNGNNVATQPWVENSATANNADMVDGKHAEDLGISIENDGSVVADPATAADFVGGATVSDDGDGTVTVDTSSPEYPDISTGESNTARGDTFVVEQDDGYHEYLVE